MIERTLWFKSEKEKTEIRQQALLGRTEPLVILGEAGMGKSTLLEWIAKNPGYALCTARQLINRHDPKSLLGVQSALVIDALDETPSKHEGDALDRVLQKLGEIGYPRFVLACRVADWRSATGIEAIREQYHPEPPLELHLFPFEKSDARDYLQEKLGEERATQVITHFEGLALDAVLGNPQTLNFIVKIAQGGPLPNTLHGLFQRIVEILQQEHNDKKADGLPPQAEGLAAAGAACAGLILTESEAIIRNPTEEADGLLPLTEVQALPGGGPIDIMLSSRLFRSLGAECFCYEHRRIAEYLGAQWLSSRADTQHKRARLLALFHHQGLVPASLRGLHAWLAQDPALAEHVIAADPMGVIEYGDTDDLTITHAQCLLKALESLATRNPRFYDWNRYAVRGIAQQELVPELRRVITSPDVPFYLSNLILESIKGTTVATALIDDLHHIALDPTAVYANRSAAALAYAEASDRAALSGLIDTLKQLDDENSTRLVIILVGKLGFDLIDDAGLVEVVIKWLKHEEIMLGVLLTWGDKIPEDRLGTILDLLTSQAIQLGKPHTRPGDDSLTHFVFQLIVHALAMSRVPAEKLWSWLEPFHAYSDSENSAYGQLADRFRQNEELRQAVQRHVLLELPGDQEIAVRRLRLIDRSSALELNQTDVVSLLKFLDPADQQDLRWKEIIQLVAHDKVRGADVREAARLFAAHSPELVKWLDDLGHPRTPEWAARQNEHSRKRKRKQQKAVLKRRTRYQSDIAELRNGDFWYNYNPARVYLNCVRESDSDLPASERIATWLEDEELGHAAHEGFEAFLLKTQDIPSAQMFSDKFIEGREILYGYIMVAALAERFHNARAFDDLPGDLLMASLIHICHTGCDKRAGIQGLRKVLEQTLVQRGLWKEFLALLIKPQLKADRKHLRGIEILVGEDEQSSQDGLDLAVEWLTEFDELVDRSESNLIDYLLQMGRQDALRHLLPSKLRITDPARRRNWDAVGLIVDFEQTAQRIVSNNIDRELIWHLRNRTGDRHQHESNISLSPGQYGWIVGKFRTLWVRTEMPKNIQIKGDAHDWQASEYIETLIRRLGNDDSQDTSFELEKLCHEETDGYTELIKAVFAEQTRIRVEKAYTPTTLEDLLAISQDTAPKSGSDLLAFMLEELRVVQNKIYSNDVDSWRLFFDDKGIPYKEERCRHHLIEILRQGDRMINYEPETHVANDKRVDITCTTGQLRLPIEIKGQWHPDLWTAADEQLDKQYTPDYQAEHCGIYLVLWFGEQTKKSKILKSPGRGFSRPKCPTELMAMLIERSEAVRMGRVEIVVLDIERA